MKEYKYKINGNNYNVAIGDIVDGKAEVLVNGTPYKVELDQKKAPVTVVSHAPKAAAAPRTAAGEKVIAKPSVASGNIQIKAPLPGTVMSINCKVGDVVKAADTVIILEAMKMENAIHAGYDGKVASITCNTGDAVLEGAVLITLE